MQESHSAQDPHPSCPSQQPHFPPSHHPTAPAPAQSLCSNPSHPLKPLSSPKELTGSQARCPALPGGSCCCPPCPGTPVDPLGSADLVSPERTNSISQCWGRIGPGSNLCQNERTQPHELQNKGSRGWTLCRAPASSPGAAAGTRQQIRLHGLCSGVLAGPGLPLEDTDLRTSLHRCLYSLPQPGEG